MPEEKWRTPPEIGGLDEAVILLTIPIIQESHRHKS